MCGFTGLGRILVTPDPVLTVMFGMDGRPFPRKLVTSRARQLLREFGADGTSPVAGLYADALALARADGRRKARADDMRACIGLDVAKNDQVHFV